MLQVVILANAGAKHANARVGQQRLGEIRAAAKTNPAE
jgi:hypothetical protein